MSEADLKRQVEKLAEGLAPGELLDVDLTADDGMRVTGTIGRVDDSDPLGYVRMVVARYFRSLTPR